MILGISAKPMLPVDTYSKTDSLIRQFNECPIKSIDESSMNSDNFLISYRIDELFSDKRFQVHQSFE